jgi:hypothetical protein
MRSKVSDCPARHAKFGEVHRTGSKMIEQPTSACSTGLAASDGGGGAFAMEALIGRADRRTRRFVDALVLEHVAPALRHVREPASKIKRSCR